MGFMSTPSRVFQSTPYIGQTIYLCWQNKIKFKKARIWKIVCIFDLIQHSRTDPKYIPNFLIAALHST